MDRMVQVFGTTDTIYFLLTVQDAPELIERVLQSEQDLSTKRNAFMMLCNHSQDRAVTYLQAQV